MSEKIQGYVNEQVLTASGSVTITDIAEKFNIDVYSAKRELYQFYSTKKNTDLNYLIMCEYSNGNFKLVQNGTELDRDGLQDVYVYGISPSKNFCIISSIREHPTLSNPWEVVRVEEESIPVENNAPRAKSHVAKAEDQEKRPSKRTSNSFASNTSAKKQHIATNENTKQEDKFSSGLRSTAILARMREERERKERERQDELRMRKEKSTSISSEKKTQMEKLMKLFDSDDDQSDKIQEPQIRTEDDIAVKDSPTVVEPADATDDNNDNLDELLETTADESFLVSSQPINSASNQTSKTPDSPEATTFVDDDGYIVTKKTQNVSMPGAVTKQGAATKAAQQPKVTKKPSNPHKKVQSSLASFFKKK
ncbi:HDL146Wp [Eremothecium sinecaudum]|uniref:HDL146Wp n=1 Tax=Eremothecium sinecaudum TaxID=45286 RepID=A0A120K271_9SACH|nr:HDL146Wp [Eremothecium sinecaudum]AMD20598.1 HDL146Wp [Eremothecium sinecaudum]